MNQIPKYLLHFKMDKFVPTQKMDNFINNNQQQKNINGNEYKNGNHQKINYPSNKIVQKQVAPKKLEWSTSDSDIQPAKVKMSGYLKKKRNKVGGWRKMWFVLQNQLLLSFNSKEEYDKKLVSFKDALNLVPGTIVRPLGGMRFTIETTSNLCYTFRCDDCKTCTDWITALVGSLALKSNYNNPNKDISSERLSKKLRNYSLENIQIPLSSSSSSPKGKLPKQMIRSSNSCDSIINQNKTKFPKLPIVESTARMLRNGVTLNDEKKSKNLIENKSIQENNSMIQGLIEFEKLERARNFRLHEKRKSSGFLNQSDEVNRINRMFSRSATIIDEKNKFELRKSISVERNTGISTSCSNNPLRKILSGGCGEQKKDSDFSNNIINNKTSSEKIIKKIPNNNKIKNPRNNLFPMENCYDGKDNNIGDRVYNEKCDKDKKTDIIKLNNKGKEIDYRDLNQNRMNNLEKYFYGMNKNKDSSTSSYENPIEQQMKRLNLKEEEKNSAATTTSMKKLYSPPNMNILNTSPSHKNDDRKKQMASYKETDNPLFLIQKHCPITPVDNKKISGLSGETVGNYCGEYTEISFSGSSTSSNSPKHHESEELLNEMEFNPKGTIKSCDVSLSPTEDAKIDKAEPIYAVVDLKNKYERRKRMQEEQHKQMTELINGVDTTDGILCNNITDEDNQERPKSANFITSGDYEEVLNFSNECLDDEDDDDDDVVSSENENIYEPINIPYNSQYHRNPHRIHALWKYFPRINIEALFEMARNRKPARNHTSKLEHSISTPITTTLCDNDNHNSPFSEIRRKLCNHRKSIKLRMKKFYKKTDAFSGGNSPPIIINDRNAFSDDELDSQGATGSGGSTGSRNSDNSLKSLSVNNTKKQTDFDNFSKYRRGQNQIFGSLTRLRKGRASLCLDEYSSNSRKKFLLIPVKNSSNYQQEIKRESLKRPGRNKDSCHSKIYH